MTNIDKQGVIVKSPVILSAMHVPLRERRDERVFGLCCCGPYEYYDEVVRKYGAQFLKCLNFTLTKLRFTIGKNDRDGWG